MIIVKCVQVLNDGYIKRFIKLCEGETEANAFIDRFKREKRFYREVAAEQCKNFSQVTVEDCKNNSIEEMVKIISLQKAMVGDEFLRRTEAIDLFNSLMESNKEEGEENADNGQDDVELQDND